jgi:hypothetical protein
MAYGSGAKYNYPNSNSIDALNQAYMQRSRSKDAVTLASQLKSNRYGGGAASVIAEGRLESQKLLMERYRRIDVSENSHITGERLSKDKYLQGYYSGA